MIKLFVSNLIATLIKLKNIFSNTKWSSSQVGKIYKVCYSIKN